MPATTVRLPDELLSALDEMAEAEHVDRSTVIRQALERGLEDLSIERAVQRYQRGGLTAWKAARGSGVGLLQLIEELEARGLGVRTDEELLEEQIEGLG